MVGVGPNGLGSFHPTAVAQLKEAGKWLRVNGEGIYATRPRPGTLWNEGAAKRFTRSKDNRIVYCFALEWPGSTLEIASLAPGNVISVEMLGFPHRLKYRWDETRALVVTILSELQDPSNRPCEHAWGFKIVGTS